MVLSGLAEAVTPEGIRIERSPLRGGAKPIEPFREAHVLADHEDGRRLRVGSALSKFAQRGDGCRLLIQGGAANDGCGLAQSASGSNELRCNLARMPARDVELYLR